MKYIEQQFAEKYAMTKEEKAGYALIFFLLRKILLEFYKHKDSSLYSLVEIISGDCDADRVDYTLRDGYATSLIKDGADVDRIIKTFCLDKRESTDFSDNFKFFPSIQALYDIDDFFLDRTHIYKVVINHHKVRRYDHLLLNTIRILLEEELKDYNKSDTLEIKTLTDMISTINEILVFDINNDINSLKKIERIFFKTSQMTDYWLLSYIKREIN